MYEPRHIIIIDEISLITDKKTIKTLERCMALGRACGYHFIICSQRLDATSVITPVMRNLIDTNIVFRLDSNSSKITICTDEASALSIQGRGIMKPGDTKVEFQSFYIAQYQIDEVVKLNSKVIKPIENTKQETRVVGINRRHKVSIVKVKCKEINENTKIKVNNNKIDNNTDVPDWVKNI